MKIGVFGGAFDPPHLSHVLAVGYALAKGNFDRILIVPCWDHAFGKKMSPFENRYQMCLKAFSIYGMKVQISPLESELKVNFTVDILEYFCTTYDRDDISLIIGEDELQQFDKWHRSEDIKRMVKIFTLNREGYSGEHGYKISNLSSTLIRDKIAGEGLTSVEDSLPTKVYEYIQENHLYKNSPLS